MNFNLPDIKGGWMYTIGKVDPSAKSMIFHKMALKHNPSILPNPEKVRKSLAEMYPKMSKREQELYDRFRVPDCECTWNRFVKLPYKDRPKKKRRKSTQVLPSVFGAPTKSVQQPTSSTVQTTSQPMTVNLVAANAINGQVPPAYPYPQRSVPQQPKTYPYPQRPVPKPPAPPRPPKLYSAAAIKIKCINYVFMLADYDLMGENQNPQYITTNGEIEYIVRPSNDGDDDFLRHMLTLLLGMQNADLDTGSQFGKDILDPSNEPESLYYEFMKLYNSNNPVMASYLNVVYAYMLRSQHGFFLQIVPSDNKVVSLISPGAGLAKVLTKNIYPPSYIPQIGLSEEDVNKKIQEVEKKYKKEVDDYNAQVQELKEAVEGARNTILERNRSLQEAKEEFDELKESKSKLEQTLTQEYQKRIQDIESQYTEQITQITTSGNQEKAFLEQRLTALEKEKEDLLRTKEEIAIALDDLRTKDGTARAELTSYRTQVIIDQQKLNDQIGDLNRQITEKEARYKTLLLEKQNLETRVSSLEADLAAKQQALASNADLIKQMEEEKTTLEEKIADLNAEKAQQGRLTKTKQDELVELRKQVATLNENLARTKQQKEKLDSKLTADINQQAIEIRDLTSQNDKLTEEKRRIENQVTSLQGEITRLESSFKAEQEKVLQQAREIEDMKASSTKETAELQARINELTELSDSLDVAKKEVDDKLADLQVEYNKLAAAKKKIEQQLQGNYSNLHGEYDKLLAAKTKADARIDELLKRQNELIAEGNGVLAEKNGLSAELSKVKAELEAARSKLATQQQSIDNYRKVEEELRRQNDEISKKLRVKETEFRTVQGERTALLEQIEDLKKANKKEMSQQKAQLSSQFAELLNNLPDLMIQRGDISDKFKEYSQFILSLREVYFSGMQQIRDKVEKECQEKSDQISRTLKERIAALEAAQATLEQEKVSAEQVQKRSESELQKLHDDLLALQTEYGIVQDKLQKKAGLEQRISELEAQLTQAGQDFNRLNAQYTEALKKERAAAQEQSTAAQQAFNQQSTAAQQVLDQVTRERDAARQVLQQVSAARDAARQELEQAQASLSSYASLREEVVALRNEKETMDKTIFDLRGQVEKMTKDIEEAKKDPIDAIASVNTKLDLTSTSTNPISIITGFMCSPVVEEQFRALSDLYDLETIGKIQLANAGNFLNYVNINSTRGFYIRAYPNLYKLMKFMSTLDRDSTSDFIVACRLLQTSLMFIQQIFATQRNREETKIMDTFVDIFVQQFSEEVANKLVGFIGNHHIFSRRDDAVSFLKTLNEIAAVSVPIKSVDYASSFVIITEMIALCDRQAALRNNCENKKQYEDLFMLTEYGIFAFLNSKYKESFVTTVLQDPLTKEQKIMSFVLRDIEKAYANSKQDYLDLLKANTLELVRSPDGKRVENAAIEEFNRQIDTNPYIKRGIEIAAVGLGNKNTAMLQMVNAIKGEIIEVLNLSINSRNILMGHNIERAMQSEHKDCFVSGVKLETKTSKENSFPIEVGNEIEPKNLKILMDISISETQNLAFRPDNGNAVIGEMTAEMISSPDPADRALLSVNTLISLERMIGTQEQIEIIKFTDVFNDLFPNIVADLNNAVSGLQRNSKIYYADLITRLKPGLLSQRLTESQGDQIAYSVGCAEQSDYFSKMDLVKIGKNIEESDENETIGAMDESQANINNSELLVKVIKSINETSSIMNIAALSTVLCYLQKEVSTKPRIALMA